MRRSFAPLIAAGSGGFATSSVLLIGAFVANLDGWSWGTIMPRLAGSLIGVGLAGIAVSTARRRMRRAGAAGMRDARAARLRFVGATVFGSFLGPLGGLAVALLLLLVTPGSPGAGAVAMVAAPALGMTTPAVVAAVVGRLRGLFGPTDAPAADADAPDAPDADRPASAGTAVSRAFVRTRAWRGAAIGAMTAPVAAGLALISTASTLRYDSLLLAALPVSLAGAVLAGVSRQMLIARLRRDVDAGLVSAVAIGASACALAVIAVVTTLAAGADATHIGDVGPFRLVALPEVVEAFLVAGVGGGLVGLAVGPVAGAVTAATLARRG